MRRKFLLATALWLLAAPAGAVVAIDTKTSTVQNANSASPLSFSYTMGSVANGALAVPIMVGGSSLPAGLAVTYNGVALTAISGTSTGTNGGCTCAGVIYGMVGPPSGAHTLSISWTTGTVEVHATVASFSGVNQTNVATAFPHGTFVVNNTATASPITAAVTSASGNIVVAAGSDQTSAWGAISGTLIASDDTTGPQLTYASNYTAGAATVSPTFAFTGPSVWMFLGTDVLAAGGGGGGNHGPVIIDSYSAFAP